MKNNAKKFLVSVLVLLGGVLPCGAFADTVVLVPAVGANYPVDGYAMQQTGPNPIGVPPPPWNGNNWGDLRNNVGNVSGDTGLEILVGFHSFAAGTGSFKGDQFQRGVVEFAFDTTQIPASSTINSATLDLWNAVSLPADLNCTLFQNAVDEDLRVTYAPIANDNAVVNTDFANLNNQTAIYGHIDANSFATSSYNTITLTSAAETYLQSLVGGAGSSTVRFGLTVAADSDNLPPGEENCTTNWRFKSADSGTSTTPFLTINFTPPSAPPPTPDTTTFDSWVVQYQQLFIYVISVLLFSALAIAIITITKAIKVRISKSRYD